MKLIGNVAGRVIWPYFAEEVNPPQGFFRPNATQAFVERYGLRMPPEDKKLEGDAVRFVNGSFPAGETNYHIEEFSIFNDAVVIETTNTEYSELILQDFISWIQSSFGYRLPARPKQCLYVSHVVVEFEADLERLVRKLSHITEKILNHLRNLYGIQAEPRIGALSFRVDPLKVPPLVVKTDFTLERRVGAAYEENRYWSVAPFRTNDHVELLEAIEELIRSN